MLSHMGERTDREQSVLPYMDGAAKWHTRANNTEYFNIIMCKITFQSILIKFKFFVLHQEKRLLIC